MSYPLDNPLRPPVEYFSAAGFLAGSGIVVLGAWPIGLPSVIALSSSLALLGALRLRQGLQISKAHLHLRRLPKYEITSQDIPFSAKEMFLGKGFWWTQKHTQMLHLVRQPKYRHLRARNERYERARQFVRTHPGHWVSRCLDWDHALNPVAPLGPVGGDPSIHGVEVNEVPIWSAISERVGHTLVLGTTRVGKTRLAEVLITQDIHRGDVVIVFDPKGDPDLLKRMYAEAVRAGRQKDFWFFHLGYPELSDRYSPISTFGRVTEVATRMANQIPGEGNSAAFKQFVWLYVNIIARTLSALGMNPTYVLLYQYAANLDSLAEQYFKFWLSQKHPGWETLKEETDGTLSEKTLQNRQMQTGRTLFIIQVMELLQVQGWKDPIADGLVAVLSNSKTRYQALINSLFPLLEKLTTGEVSELMSPDWSNPLDKRRTFDWDKIMNMGGIIYIGLDALSDADVAAAVGNSMFADLTSTAGRRYKFGTAYGQSTPKAADKAQKVSIHADEFNELIGPEFTPMLNKAGGAGYQVTAYTQTWADVEARLGNAAKAEQISGNFNSLLMLRVKNVDTAEILTKQLPMVEVSSTTLVSGATDTVADATGKDFTANAQDRLATREVEMISPGDLTNLPKGQAFALLEGGQLAKIRLPYLQADTGMAWPDSMQAVYDGMKKQYINYVDTVESVGFDGSFTYGLTQQGLHFEE